MNNSSNINFPSFPDGFADSPFGKDDSAAKNERYSLRTRSSSRRRRRLIPRSPQKNPYAELWFDPDFLTETDGHGIINTYEEDAQKYQEKADELTKNLDDAKKDDAKQDIKKAKLAIKKFGRSKMEIVARYRRIEKLKTLFRDIAGEEEYNFFDNLSFKERAIRILVTISSDFRGTNKEAGSTAYNYDKKSWYKHVWDTKEERIKKGKKYSKIIGIVADQFIITLYNDGYGDSFRKADPRSGLSTFANELGDVKFAVEQPQKNERDTQLRLPYYKQGTAQFSFDYEEFVMGKQNKPDSNNKKY